MSPYTFVHISHKNFPRAINNDYSSLSTNNKQQRYGHRAFASAFIKRGNQRMSENCANCDTIIFARSRLPRSAVFIADEFERRNFYRREEYSGASVADAFR